jgi:hypothetical protein
LTKFLLEIDAQSPCFFSTRDLEVVKEREIQVEGVEDLWFDL